MSIKVRQLAHVCIFARDVDETRRFYEDVIGLKTVFNFLREGRIFGFYLDAGDRTFVEVFENASATAARTRSTTCASRSRTWPMPSPTSAAREWR
jgi:glyoxylase I family protein